MNESEPDRRLAENEVIFRQYNEKIQQGFDNVKRIAQEDNQAHFVMQGDAPLYFYCECSDEECSKRVLVKPSRYNEIHMQRDQFIIVCGHETTRIEHVINRADNYCVIEKFLAPPESAGQLNDTDVNNS